MQNKSLQTCIQEYMYTHACTYILSNARTRANGFRVDIQSSLQLVPPRSHMETHQKNVSDKTVVQIPLRTAHDVLIRTVCEHALITCVLLHVHALGPPQPLEQIKLSSSRINNSFGASCGELTRQILYQ